jgi:hypothetical protein
MNKLGNDQPFPKMVFILLDFTSGIIHELRKWPCVLLVLI